MTYRDDATRALYLGLCAEVGETNPYAGASRTFAVLWLRGYRRMLRERYAAPRHCRVVVRASADLVAAERAGSTGWLSRIRFHDTWQIPTCLLSHN